MLAFSSFLSIFLRARLPLHTQAHFLRTSIENKKAACIASIVFYRGNVEVVVWRLIIQVAFLFYHFSIYEISFLGWTARDTLRGLLSTKILPLTQERRYRLYSALLVRNTSISWYIWGCMVSYSIRERVVQLPRNTQETKIISRRGHYKNVALSDWIFRIYPRFCIYGKSTVTICRDASHTRNLALSMKGWKNPPESYQEYQKIPRENYWNSLFRTTSHYHYISGKCAGSSYKSPLRYQYFSDRMSI